MNVKFVGNVFYYLYSMCFVLGVGQIFIYMVEVENMK